ncbi:MAG: ATP synthase F1 subunit gamma [Candidatus Goldbacteria bacterium]|nr:ATP synthase F1 subunit gamma [Candidatus Goldiibacteriota bacterium]
MPTLRAIRKRIKSAKNIQQITKAMKMVAAAKLRKAQERILSSRPYAIKIQEVISELITNVELSNYPLLNENKDISKEGLILITADKGLCGSFNSNLIKEALYKLKENNNTSLILIGKKGLDYFKKFNFEIELFKYNDKKISWFDIEEIGKLIIDNYIKKKYRRVTLINSEFQTNLQQKIVKSVILPISFEFNKENQTVIKRDFIYEPDERTVLLSLIEKYIKSVLFRAILESQASEHGVRMVAMEMATNNAGEMIKGLTLIANKVRQASITKEILEIIGGAEAIKG